MATRRLRCVAAALGPPAAAPAAAAPARIDGLPPAPKIGRSDPEGPRFMLTDEGLPPDDHAAVLRRIDEAVAAADFREAASLQTIVRALGPRPPWDVQAAVEFGRTASLDNKTEAFFERGFAVLPDAVEPALLARMQAAWTRKSEVMEPLWRQRVATNASSNPRGKPGRFESRVSPRAFDMPTADFFSGDDGRVLLEVVALPSVVELLERVVAPRPGLRLCGVQARTVVPQPAEAVGGYTNWHRDSGQTDGWPLPHTRIVKVFLPLFDVELNTGPSAVVPLTHRLEEAPQQVATFGSAGGLQADRPGMEQAAMPNYIPFAVKAGTACMMDQCAILFLLLANLWGRFEDIVGRCIWHTAFPNTSEHARRQLIIGYQAATKRGGTGAIPSAADIARYEREGGPLRPEIRELLGDAAHQSTN